MTTFAARGRLRGTGLVLGSALGAAGIVAASAAVPIDLLLAGIVASAAAIAIVLSPQAGLAAVAVFTVLRVPEVATQFHSAPSLFLPLLALIALGVVIARRDPARVGHGGVGAAVVLGVFLATAAVSLLAAPDAPDVVGRLRGIAEDGSVAVLAGVLLRGSASLRRLMWVLVLAGGAIGVLAVAQFALGEFSTNFGGLAQWAVQNIVDGVDSVRISGPVGDPNFFAQWLVMLVPLAVDRYASETSPRLRLLGAACALAMTTAIVLTFSRGAILGLAVVGGLLLVRSPRRLRTAGVVVAATAALVLLAPGQYLERLGALGDVGGVQAGIDPSVRGRTAELTAALQMFSSDPLTGVGYGAYVDRYVETAREIGIDLRSTPREAHNLALQFAAEMGVLGLLLLGGIVLAVGTAISRGRKHFRRMSDLIGDGIGFALAASLTGYLVTSVFLHLDFARLPWLLAGTALALPRIARIEDTTRDDAARGVTS